MDLLGKASNEPSNVHSQRTAPAVTYPMAGSMKLVCADVRGPADHQFETEYVIQIFPCLHRYSPCLSRTVVSRYSRPQRQLVVLPDPSLKFAPPLVQYSPPLG